MTAEVTTIRRYQAYCPDCGWWADEVDSDMAADRQADKHDEEYHP